MLRVATVSRLLPKSQTLQQEKVKRLRPLIAEMLPELRSTLDEGFRAT
jgi:hypothetical protein